MDAQHATVSKFLQAHHTPGIPFLLGFSGGPDSLALFHLLLMCQNEQGIRFAIAHVDHGWREESSKEAQEIAAMAKDKGIVCHVKTLQPHKMKGNLEAACREARLAFFSTLCSEYGYQAVMLAHHADDLAETVLKRVLEGAPLTQLGGMKPVAALDGMTVWRPLLSLKKKDILAWLARRNLTGIYDRTNDDPRYLRARMRREIIPGLTESFGKEVEAPLCRLGAESAELQEYFDARMSPLMKRCVEGAVGFLVDADVFEALPDFEVKLLIARLFTDWDFPLSRDAQASVLSLIRDAVPDKCFKLGTGNDVKTVYIDKGRLLFPKKMFVSLPDAPVDLAAGKKVVVGNWVLEAEKSRHSGKAGKTAGWRCLWESEGEIWLPEGDYQLAAPHLGWRCGGGTLAKRWSSAGVPAILRKIVPVVMKDGTVVHEFLTGRPDGTGPAEDIPCLRVSIRWQDKVSG